MRSITLSIRRYAYCALGVIALLLTSCTYSVLAGSIGDGGLLSGKPCPAPCFWGIEPGKTSKNEALQVLERHGIAEYEQSGNTVHYGDSIHLEFGPNEIVRSIQFAPDREISLKGLVSRYGVPDAVEIVYDAASTPEHIYFHSGLFYRRLLAYFVLEKQQTWPDYTVRTDTHVSAVTYFVDDAYDAAWASSKDITGWKGYGRYQAPSTFNSP